MQLVNLYNRNLAIHIIQVTDKKEKEPFEEVKDEMEYQLK